MPRPRFETLDPERRHRILASAAESFRRGGLYGASLNDILAVAGISKGVFYYYFDDKLDLYATVVDEAVRRFEAVFEEPHRRSPMPRQRRRPEASAENEFPKK